MSKRVRQQRKNARNAAKIERKKTGSLGAIGAKLAQNMGEASQARIAKRGAGTQSRVAKRADKNTVSSMQTEQPEVTSRLAEVDAAQETGNTNLTNEQRQKAVNYLKRKGIKPTNDPDILPAQVMDIREQEIAAENARQIQEYKTLNTSRAGVTFGEEGNGEAPEETIDEDELPDLDDTHEDIMESEAQEFGFDGDETNYLDPSTVGVIYNAGTAAAEKYRQNQFKRGKKAFGDTKASWEAKQAKKAAGDSPLAAAQKKIDEDVTKNTWDEYKDYVYGLGILLIIGGVYLYYKGKSNG